MSFSLAVILDYLDSEPEHVVMAMVAQAFTDSGQRGIFSEKFISYSDLHMLGYGGFRQMLVSLYQTDPLFVEAHRQELYALTRRLKGEE
jgi:hypothetical protein